MTNRPTYALVTGCGEGGIGEALVKSYKAVGVHPIATVLPSESKQHLVVAGIDCLSLDVTDERSIIALREAVASLTGGYVDVLINNAGICYTMPAVDTDVKEVQVMFDVNLFGPMRMVHHFYDAIIKAKGTIINISSVGGIVPYCYGSSYNASKAALQHWSDTLRFEMLPFDVRVITVISGEVATNILKRDQGINRELPTGSIFSPISEAFKQHINRVPDTMDRFDYAKSVVAQSLKPRPAAWFWHGKSAGLVRFLHTFLFRTIWHYIFWGTFKFDKLQNAHRRRFKEE